MVADSLVYCGLECKSTTNQCHPVPSMTNGVGRADGYILERKELEVRSVASTLPLH